MSRQGPKTAMVLAAGLGTRMRPLTNDRPKALIEVGGRPLIDHLLDRLEAQGVERIVVNVHAFADQLQTHLEQRRGPAEILISDERGELLETGGGVKKAQPLLGEEPIWVANGDYVWIEDGQPALEMVADAWDPARMDSCLIVVPKARTLGFDTPGDFSMGADGSLEHRDGRPAAPTKASAKARAPRREGSSTIASPSLSGPRAASRPSARSVRKGRWAGMVNQRGAGPVRGLVTPPRPPAGGFQRPGERRGPRPASRSLRGSRL